MVFRREAVIKKAEKLVSRGKVESAIKEYRKVLQKNPNDISSLNRVGDLYARIDQIENAVGLFSQIAQRYTDDGFFPKAIAIFKKILKLDPRRIESYERLAELYQKQGLVNDARAQYQVLADYYQKHGEGAKAIAVFQTMSSAEPENPSHHVKLADLYRENQQIAEALAEYRTIADLMLAHGHVGEAAQVYHRALDIGASDLDFVRRAVDALKDAGDVPAAAKLAQAAADLNPGAKAVAAGLGAPAPAPAVAPAPTMPSIPSAPVAPPPLPAPEPPPEFDLDESFGSIDDPPSTLVEPPSDLETTPELDAEAIDIGGGLGMDAGEDIPLEIDWSDMPSLEEAEEPPEVGPLATPATPVATPTEPLRKVEDLLAEAEVFSKYGLALKALDRLRDAITAFPDSLAAHRQLIRLLQQHEDRDAVLEAAAQMRDTAERLGETEQWTEVHAELASAGYALIPEVAEEEAEFPESLVLEPEEEPELESVAADEELELVAEEVPIEETHPADEAVELEAVLEAESETEIEAEVEAEPEFEVEPEPEAEIEAELEAEPEPEPEVEELEPMPPAEEEPGLPELELAETEAEPLAVELPEPTAPPQDVRARRPRVAGGIDAALAEITAQVLRPKKKKKKVRPVVPEPQPEPEAEVAPDAELEALVPEAELEATTPEPEPEVVAAAPEVEEEMPEPDVSIAGALDESGMDWLDEVAASELESESAADRLFDEEDDFFDLAAELQDELGAEDELTPIGEPQEQSLEEIVEGFKKGVSEALSEEDVDTHYNLGIAYREMGLVDEAIGEFQLAAKDPGYLVNCCAMLGVCFLEKGLPELAVKWYQRALEHPELNEEETLGLLYDLGSAQLGMGEHAAAHETFVQIYGINSNYRDASEKLQEAAAASG